MGKEQTITSENQYFTATCENGVLVLRWTKHLMHLCYDVKQVFAFYEYMQSILSSGGFNILVSISPDQKPGFEESACFLKNILDSKESNKYLERFFNVINTYVLSLSTLNAVTIHVDHGQVSQFNLNLSLAYDYRIVAEDTVFNNYNADLGLITKGGGAYFLSRLLGVKKATEVMQWSSYAADDAFQLGIVDHVAPLADLEPMALRLATAHQTKPAMLLALRKLLKCDVAELKRNLELENHLIASRIATADFRKTFADYCAARSSAAPGAHADCAAKA